MSTARSSKSESRSVCQINHNSQQNRTCAKLTTTCSASGLSAPFFMTMSSLGPDELLLSKKELEKKQ